MEITLNNFKELISGLSADEMIDMIPEKIMTDKRWGIYSKKSWNTKANINGGCFEIKYCDKTECNIDYISIDPKHACKKMLLRLLENNYLSYKLITDGKENLGSHN